MSDTPAPKNASLLTDDRGVSTTLGYTLTLSITAILIAGLLTAGVTLVDDQRRAVATDELTVTGQQLAGGFEDADRLAGTTANGTVRVNVWLPADVGSGGEYTLRLVNQTRADGQPARATIVAAAESVDVTRNVSFRTEHAVANRTIPGGPVTIAFDDADGDGVRELVVHEQEDLAPEPTEPAAVDHEEIVYVDDDTGELSSVAPGGEVTGYDVVDAEAIGPKQADLDADGLHEVPFVTAENELRLVDENGEMQTLATDAASNVDGSTSLLAVGDWRGDTSVFYLNTSHTEDGWPSIYRSAPGESPEQVTVSGDGIDATAISGVGDVDDNSDDDLVYVDHGDDVRYVDDTDDDDDLGLDVDADEGAAIGDLRQFDDGDPDAIPFVDDDNDVHLYEDGSRDWLTDDAANTAVAGIDWNDENDALEVVYVDESDGTLRYVDLDGDGDEIESDGEDVQADDDTGVA